MQFVELDIIRWPNNTDIVKNHPELLLSVYSFVSTISSVAVKVLKIFPTTFGFISDYFIYSDSTSVVNISISSGSLIITLCASHFNLFLSAILVTTFPKCIEVSICKLTTNGDVWRGILLLRDFVLYRDFHHAVIAVAGIIPYLSGYRNGFQYLHNRNTQTGQTMIHWRYGAPLSILFTSYELIPTIIQRTIIKTTDLFWLLPSTVNDTIVFWSQTGIGGTFISNEHFVAQSVKLPHLSVPLKTTSSSFPWAIQ